MPTSRERLSMLLAEQRRDLMDVRIMITRPHLNSVDELTDQEVQDLLTRLQGEHTGVSLDRAIQELTHRHE